jgi:hypothetical protein
MTKPLLPLTQPADSTLHTPDSFRVTDVEKIVDWLAQYPLVTLVTADEQGRPRSSVSPLLLRRGVEHLRLYAHLDRRNPQVEHLAAGRRALIIAQGPQAYVSPAWFQRRPAAPRTCTSPSTSKLGPSFLIRRPLSTSSSTPSPLSNEIETDGNTTAASATSRE